MIFPSLPFLSYFTLLLYFANNAWSLSVFSPSSGDTNAIFPRAIDPSAPVRYYSARELVLIWEACVDIQRLVGGNDIVFFVGNSGGYLAYCFDHPRMGPIPLSKSRSYYRLEPSERQSDPHGYGVIPDKDTDHMLEYYHNYLWPKFGGKAVDRIILVDHSSSGRSVDATRAILMDCIWQRYRQLERAPSQFYNDWDWSGKFLLYNFIGRRKQFSDGTFDVENPKRVPIFRQFTAGGNHEVDHLLADEGYHDRVQAEYYPRRFDRTTTDIWAADGGFPQAQRMRQQIRDYVRSRNNGQLLSPPRLNLI
ncbi:hypothetical protein BDV96DRAFT_654037 [Lophiotrema nucula]|uniref:Alpha/Beta hydrolase protein n=1 Tax=Lophiotrema nucula TaxID=690887 RepID=A0A6A5YIW6_9PLEO|nr:hypothetical protein BDV96DRAFT_654037 [Lophiotrema nucula]